MGKAASVFASILEVREDKIVETAHLVTFSTVPFISDHFDRVNIEEGIKAIALLDGTLMVFDVDEDEIKIHDYQQQGTIKGGLTRFTYTNEFFWGPHDVFSVYCMILPPNYYPKAFIAPAPHFAARINGRIRATWWFTEKVKVALQVERNEKKSAKFRYIDAPNFIDKHPLARGAYQEAKDLIARVISSQIPGAI